MMMFGEYKTFNTKIDETDADNVLVGESATSDDGSGAVWRIKRINIAGAVTTITYADNDNDFSKVWDDRAGYSY
jgi:hypothetical protein